MVYPIKVRAYNAGGVGEFNPIPFYTRNDIEYYIDWLDYMINKETDLPLTISISYGKNECVLPPLPPNMPRKSAVSSAYSAPAV
jgi:hypothetical protein